MKKQQKLGKAKLIALLGLIVVLLAACSSGNGANNGNAAQTDTPAASPGAAEGQKELTLFVDQPWWPLTDWSGKIPEEITKRTGIKINVQVASDAQQLPLMIASGAKMPDIVYTSENHQSMSHENVSYTWDELMKKYGANIEIEPMLHAVNQANDGNLYTIRNNFMSPEERKADPRKALVPTGGLALREDILEELGNPKLETLDDLLSILAAVKSKHPEMTPLVAAAGEMDTYFRLNFGVARYGFDMVDGKVTYFINDPAQHDYYMFMNKLYREGYITAENFTWKDPKQHETAMINGKAFGVMAGEGASELINPQLEKNGKDFRIKQITNLLGEHPRWITDGNSPGWSGMYVPKQAKDPETAIKFIEFMRSKEGQELAMWGIEGEDWTRNAEGFPEFKYDTTSADVQKEMGVIWWGILASDGAIERMSRYVPGKPSTEAMVEAAKVDDSNPLLGVFTPQQESEEQVAKSSIDEMIKNEEMKIYLAESEDAAEQAYQAMMKLAKDMGLDKLESWANEQYTEVQSRLNQ